jgi:hypothetical protein
MIIPMGKNTVSMRRETSMSNRRFIIQNNEGVKERRDAGM